MHPHDSARLPLVVALTGASGSVYGVRLLDVLSRLGHRVELLISPAAAQVANQELGLVWNLDDFRLESLWRTPEGRAWWEVLGEPFAKPDGASVVGETSPDDKIEYFHYQDYLAPAASGSHRTAGMVICPCSSGTLSALVHGAASNLIVRAAEVHLKERRRLLLVPRETPLSLPLARNLVAATEAGAVVLPASPGWYHRPRRLHDLVDFVVGRVLDQLGIDHQLVRRWGESR
ncbi:MAG: flavin prenyltransferase UbiX [Pirellulaceae bacterium]|nr:MAG: flavin prenyltransferase UbiX [Pirellulaceae bacterium]